MRTRPNFGIVGQSRPATNNTPGTVMTMIDYVNNIVDATANPTAYSIDAVNATGGTITYSGNYKIHTYTGSGTFVPTFTGNVELMLIGGGGAGDPQFAGGVIGNGPAGGGGSGGVVYYGNEVQTVKQGSALTVTAGTTYTITIGGGASQSKLSFTTSANVSSGQGVSSTFVGGAHNLTAYGGGFGRYSGGGAGGAYHATTSSQGPGSGSGWRLTYQYTSDVAYTFGGGLPAPGQGYAGGPGVHARSSFQGGGGGGGGGVGRTAFGDPPVGVAVPDYSLYSGNGGIGFKTSISGTEQYYAGGGGGAGLWVSYVYPTYGGLGGGGNGGYESIPPGTNVTSTASTPGSANTGGGGGAYCNGVLGAGAGGSGICIIRYLNL